MDGLCAKMEPKVTGINPLGVSFLKIACPLHLLGLEQRGDASWLSWLQAFAHVPDISYAPH